MTSMSERRPMDEIVDHLVQKHSGVTLREYIEGTEPHAWSAPELTAAVVVDFGIPAEQARAAVDYLVDLPEEDPRG
jgi:hypothetical protein